MNPTNPTVGRILWFYAYTPGRTHSGPRAAIICSAGADNSVNLITFTESGQPLPRVHVPLIQDGQEIPTTDYCAWPVYQPGPAQREAFQEQLAAR